MKTTVAVCYFVLALFINWPATYAQRPEPRWISGMVYDKANNRAILFGGADERGVLTDLWSFKNSKWEKLDNSGPGIIKCSFTYDINRKKIVLYGGSGAQPLMSETWEWDGHSWEKKNIAGPGARNHAMSAYDPEEKAVILFGGAANGTLMSDTWSYDGVSWTLRDKDGPKNCIAQGIFYDESRSKLMLLTRSATHDADNPRRTSNQLWEWSGKSWRNIPGGTFSIPGESLQALSQFSNSEIILFDGDDILNNHGRTWVYSKVHWRDLPVNGPGARVGHCMLYNPATAKIILLGGSDRQHFFNDLWEWDGKAWKEIQVL